MNDTRDEQRSRRFPLLVLLAGSAALALAACGGGAGEPESANSGSEGEATPQEEAGLDYAQCMRDNGLEDFPDPESGAEGGLSFDGMTEQQAKPGFEAADEACQPIIEAVGTPEPPEGGEELTPDELAEVRDKWLGIAECVRAEGFDFPDPEIDAYGNVRRVQTDDLGFAAAEEQCITEAGG